MCRSCCSRPLLLLLLPLALPLLLLRGAPVHLLLVLFVSVIAAVVGCVAE
jgi:hypothetical protein